MIRKATLADLPQLQQVYAAARAYMKANGNPTQWGDTSPEEKLVLASIAAGECWVLWDQDGIYGTFCLQAGEEPTYAEIIDGAWLDDAPYLTVHRLASDGSHSGVLSACLTLCDSLTDNIRIDTHRNNATMHHLLQKQGFVRCGIIYVADGSERIAYQRHK